MFRTFLTAAVLLAAWPASALVDLAGSCDQDTGAFAFTVVVVNDLVAGDPAGYEIVLQQTLAGSCDIPTVAPLPPMPVPAFLTEATYQATMAAPFPERTWHYRAALRAPDGGLQPLGPFGTVIPQVALSWGAAPAVRGVLEADASGTFYHIVACAQDCGLWLCYEKIDLSRIHPAQFEPYLRSGEAVDVHGELLANVPADGACLNATLVEPARGDPCAPVPVRAASWGSVKSAYR